MMDDLFPDAYIPEIKEGKVCTKCGEFKHIEAFPDWGNQGYRRNECTPCLSKLRQIRRDLEKIYPYPDEDYCCPVCERSQEEIRSRMSTDRKTFCLDHDHETNEFRGWICERCNTGLGSFFDEESRLLKAIDYLRKHNGKEEG